LAYSVISCLFLVSWAFGETENHHPAWRGWWRGGGGSGGGIEGGISESSLG